MPSLVVVADRKILFVHDEAVAHHEWLLFQTMNEGFGTGVMIAIFFGTHTTNQLMLFSIKLDNHANNTESLCHYAQLSLGDNYVAITPFVNLLVRGYGQ